MILGHIFHWGTQVEALVVVLHVKVAAPGEAIHPREVFLMIRPLYDGVIQRQSLQLKLARFSMPSIQKPEWKLFTIFVITNLWR